MGGMFGSKPKAPDYAAIQAKARQEEEARAAAQAAQDKQAQQEAFAAGETKRKAFYSGIVSQPDDQTKKRFLQAV